tara:strand:- start:17967 stop:18242 length:276 start_codon:yes stop_codon:yes gene_type:complete
MALNHLSTGLKTPPKVTLINNLGIERLGESSPKRLAVVNKGVEPFERLRLNSSELLMSCREVATFSQKLQGETYRKCHEDIFSERASRREG